MRDQNNTGSEAGISGQKNHACGRWRSVRRIKLSRLLKNGDERTDFVRQNCYSAARLHKDRFWRMNCCNMPRKTDSDLYAISI
jgi:hypothetical protein